MQRMLTAPSQTCVELPALGPWRALALAWQRSLHGSHASAPSACAFRPVSQCKAVVPMCKVATATSAMSLLHTGYMLLWHALHAAPNFNYIAGCEQNASFNHRTWVRMHESSLLRCGSAAHITFPVASFSVGAYRIFHQCDGTHVHAWKCTALSTSLIETPHRQLGWCRKAGPRQQALGASWYL